jgi:hypothetical protein
MALLQPPFIAVVGCSRQKREQAAPAREICSPSPLFQAYCQWAQQNAHQWYILSGKYGLVLPEQILEPYDQPLIQSLQDADFCQRWFAQLQQYIPQVGTVFALMSDQYADLLEKALITLRGEEWVRNHYVQPLQGLKKEERLLYLARNTISERK